MEASIGAEPQPCTVGVYHAQPLVGTVRGERDDLNLTTKKVVVLGLEKGGKGGAGKGDTEFVFDETHGPTVAPQAVAQSCVPFLVHGLSSSLAPP